MEKTLLGNGITVLTKTIPSSQAVSIGIWIKTGSIHEKDSESGYAHFLEHMLFKGTKKRTAKKIAQEIDKAGAYINAGTSKEYTSYYINIIKDKLGLALDILTDIIENSIFLKNEIQKEKQVVLEEIKMYEDTPSELVQDNLVEAMLIGHPAGHSILGDKNIIKNITREKIVSFYTRNYFSSNIIISAAGNISHNKIVEYFRKAKFFNKKAGSIKAGSSIQNKVSSRDIIIPKDLSQVHFCLGFPGIPINGRSRYALYILNAFFGSSMSSRLFQRIRESLGLCYSIYSFNYMYVDCGIFGVYAGTGIDTFQKALSEILKEIKKLKNDKLTSEEINSAKEHLKGNMALAYENIETHMNSLARQEIYYKKHITLKEQIRLIDKVKLSDIHEVMEMIFPAGYKTIISSIGNKKHLNIIDKIDRTIQL